MTAGLTISVDQNEQRVDVSVELQEGKQYRVGSVQISGLGSKTENLLRSLLEPGRVFDGGSIKNLLKENREMLPVDASEKDVSIEGNPEDATVAIVLDFRRCSRARTAGEGSPTSR
jgi:outer membrane protein assembly factor BamA